MKQLVLALFVIVFPFWVLAQGIPTPTPSGPGGTFNPSDILNSVGSKADNAFQQAQAGALLRTLAAKVKDGCVSPQDFSAKQDGATDDSAAVQAAMNAAGGTGGNGCVYFPSGPAGYRVHDLVVNAYNNLTLICAGPSANGGGGAKLVAAYNTSSILTVSSVSGFFAKGCSFLSASQQVAGSLVTFYNVNSSGLSDYFMNGAWNNITITGGNGLVFNDGRVRNFNHDAVYIDGGSAGGPVGINGGDIYFKGFISDQDSTGTTPNACFEIVNSAGAITWDGGVDALHCHYGILVNPGAGQIVSWLYGANVFLDSCDFPTVLRGGVGLKVTPHNGGIANGASFVNLWSSTCSSAIQLAGDGAAGTVLDDYQFANFRALHSYGDGVDLGYATNVFFSQPTISGGGTSAANTYFGMHLGAGADRVSVTGGHIGAAETYPASFKTGLYLDSGFNGHFTMLGSDLSGNMTGAIADNAPASAPVRIESTLGYNPLGPAILTVGSSPYVYTAGRTKELLYIVGGAVSSVVVTGSGGNITVCTASPCTTLLGPEQVMAVTYSSAPTIVTNRD